MTTKKTLPRINLSPNPAHDKAFACSLNLNGATIITETSNHSGKFNVPIRFDKDRGLFWFQGEEGKIAAKTAEAIREAAQAELKLISAKKDHEWADVIAIRLRASYHRNEMMTAKDFTGHIGASVLEFERVLVRPEIDPTTLRLSLFECPFNTAPEERDQRSTRLHHSFVHAFPKLTLPLMGEGQEKHDEGLYTHIVIAYDPQVWETLTRLNNALVTLSEAIREDFSTSNDLAWHKALEVSATKLETFLGAPAQEAKPKKNSKKGVK